MTTRLLLCSAVLAATTGTGFANAHTCTFDAEIPDFTQEQIDAPYDCVRDDLVEN